MSVFSRSLIAATAGTVLIGLSACTGGSSQGGEQPPAGGSGLAAFDPCTFFQQEELASFGVSAQGEVFSPLSFRPGCKWDGDLMGITLNKDLEETVGAQDREQFDTYTPKSIGGRTAAVAVVAGGEGTGGCNVFVDAGGGMVIYGIAGKMRDSIPDPCGELEKIANQTASRLPK